MALVRFRGDAPAVAQVVHAVPANVEVGDTFSLAINGKEVRYTAVAATIADVTAGLAAAIAASPHPEFAEVAATADSAKLVLAARAAGVPFAVSGSAANGSGANTQTLTLTTIVPSAGPHHWDTAANWSGGSVPAAGDHVTLEDSAVSLRYGLNQSSVSLASLRIAASFTGEIGLPRENAAASSSYAEYRERFLTIGAAVIEIGHGAASRLGGGSGRVQLALVSSAAAIAVHGAAFPAEEDLPAILLASAPANSTLDVSGGSVGVAIFGGQTASLAAVRAAGGDTICGAGVSLGEIQLSGQARLTIASTTTEIVQSGGELLVLGEADAASLAIAAGRTDWRSNGTIDELSLDGPAALADFAGDLRPRTVTNCTLRRGAISDPHETVAWTNGIQPAASLFAG